MGSQRLLSVISPFWQGDTGSAQMQTGSEPGCTDTGDPLSQPGKGSRWTARLLCLKLREIRKNLGWHPQRQSNSAGLECAEMQAKYESGKTHEEGNCVRINQLSVGDSACKMIHCTPFSSQAGWFWTLRLKPPKPWSVFLLPSIHPCSKSQRHLGPSHSFHLVPFFHKYYWVSILCQRGKNSNLKLLTGKENIKRQVYRK